MIKLKKTTLRNNLALNQAEATATVKARTKKKVKSLITSTVIFQVKMIFTSFTRHLTRNQKRRMTQAVIISIQKVIFMVPSQPVNLVLNTRDKELIKIQVRNSSNNKHIHKTTNMREALTLKLTSSMIKLLGNSSRRSFSIGSSETIRISKRQRITGPTLRRTATRSKLMLSGEQNELTDSVSTHLTKTLNSIPKIEVTPRKILVKAGVRRFRISTSKCLKFKTSTNLGKTTLVGRIMILRMPKGTSTARRTNP